MTQDKAAKSAWPVPLVLAFGAVGGLSVSFAFGKLADGPLKRQIGSLDHELSDVARGKTGPVLEQASKAVTWAGAPVVLYPVSGLVAAKWLLEKRPAGALALGMAVGGSAVLSGLVKRVVKRPRPLLRIALANFGSSSSGLPSDHAAMSVATYGTIAYLLSRRRKRAKKAAGQPPKSRRRGIIWGSVLLLCALIGWSRVYEGVHRPTDVLAGWLLGGIWAVTCAEAFNSMSARLASTSS